MSILYHLTILPSVRPECEAISQEVSALQRRFAGHWMYINPNERALFYIPRLLFGFHRLREIRRLEDTLCLHHLYNPDPFPFPYLLLLRRPVIYSLTGGVIHLPNPSFLARMAAVTVMDEDSRTRLQDWGLENVFLVRPGIDTTRFTHHPLPLESEVRLLVGSAPWTREQFRTKGILALLEAAQREPRLHLVFLWRGVLVEEMNRLVTVMGLQNRVTILNRVVDVNQVLAEVHASIVLATTPTIVKAYPHSLMESLAAGKPVLVSRAIPMARYVEKTGCGRVLERVTASDILTAIGSLAQEYQLTQEIAQAVGKRDFALESMVASFGAIYESLQ
ncbi:MAG: glycosyltransferase [Anaerolineae bacterium]|jgi:glycosyltransferase involved in cell wall biosynthesis|nr:glycosyltransferase [Anaerolineae bacterium]